MNRRMAGALGLVLLGACGAAISAHGLLQQAASILQELSVPEHDAREGILHSLWDGTPDIYGGQKVFTAASPERRAALVRAAGAYVKAYTRTPQFRDAYASYWQANRPREPEAVGSLPQLDQQAQSAMKEMEATLSNPSLTPEMRAQMENAIKQVKAQFEAQLKNTEQRAMMADALKAQQAEQQRDYAARLKEYERDQPKDPNLMIAKRLREFLDLSVTVTFDAKVARSGGLLRFVSAADEAQSREWKYCYRAGREATMAARAFAQDWLRELEGAK